jgi:hypothetical protein
VLKDEEKDKTDRTATLRSAGSYFGDERIASGHLLIRGPVRRTRVARAWKPTGDSNDYLRRVDVGCKVRKGVCGSRRRGVEKGRKEDDEGGSVGEVRA